VHDTVGVMRRIQTARRRERPRRRAALPDRWCVFAPTMLPAGLRGNPTSVGQNNYVQLVE
jgi:hypothetical protein